MKQLVKDLTVILHTYPEIIADVDMELQQDTAWINIIDKKVRHQIRIHNSTIPEIESELYANPSLTLYYSSGSRKDALQYLSKLFDDVHVLANSQVKIETFKFGPFSKSRITTNKELKGPIGRYTHRPQPEFLWKKAKLQ